MKNSKKPYPLNSQISVCIATYNGEIYIRDQLYSILCQLSDEDEIIISDDGSTDNTIPIVKSINDSRIKIIRNNNGKGYVSNFENALNHASGKYIFLCDQDDIWEPYKISKCIEAFDNGCDFIVHDATIIDGNGNNISSSYFEIRKPYFSLTGNLVRFGFLGCCIAFKRNILSKALPFPTNHRLCTHDNWLYLIGAIFFNVAYIRDPLIRYRRHGLNVSTGGLKNNTTLSFKIRYRLYLIKNLLQRFCN